MPNQFSEKELAFLDDNPDDDAYAEGFDTNDCGGDDGVVVSPCDAAEPHKTLAELVEELKAPRAFDDNTNGLCMQILDHPNFQAEVAAGVLTRYASYNGKNIKGNVYLLVCFAVLSLIKTFFFPGGYGQPG